MSPVDAGAIAARDAFIAARVEEECVGCETIPDHDRETGEPLEGWRPAELCPVHGAHTDPFWHELNEELERRYPRGATDNA